MEGIYCDRRFLCKHYETFGRGELPSKTYTAPQTAGYGFDLVERSAASNISMISSAVKKGGQEGARTFF